MFPELEPVLTEPDPVKKFIFLVLCMAHEDRATALVFTAAAADGSATAGRCEIKGEWIDFPPFGVSLSSVATELERMAGLSPSVRQGILDQTVAGVRMRWRVDMTALGAEYLLTWAPE